MEEQTDYIIKETVICNRCGKKNDIDNNFCANCANSLKKLNYQNNNVGNESDIANNIANYVFNKGGSDTPSNIKNIPSNNTVNILDNNFENPSNGVLNDISNNKFNNISNIQNSNQNLEKQDDNNSSDGSFEKLGVLGVIGIILMLPYVFSSISFLIFFIIMTLLYNLLPVTKKYINIILSCCASLVLSAGLFMLILFGACFFLIGAGS